MKPLAANSMPATVVGVGIDLVDNDRMKDALQRWGKAIKTRVFLPEEQAYCDEKPQPWRHYAGRFAVKESVTKAFGTGIGRHVGWLDIEVIRDESTGAPSVQLGKRGLKLAQDLGVLRVLVSLSHTRQHAVAQAVLVGDGCSRKEEP